MKLSNSTAVIRPRNPWEAMDLGFRMVQRDFWPLAGRWAIATLPWLLLVVAIGYLSDNIGIALFVFWWLKPAFDRVVLEYLSQRLFSQEVAPTSLWQLCIKTPFSHSSWRHLTYLRLSAVRSYSLPIYQLEGQSSGQLSSRLKTILSRDYGAASWLTILLALVAICAQSALVIFFNDFFRPESQYADVEHFLESLIFDEEIGSNLNFFVKLAIFYIVHSVIELFFVAAGFALYLNRRTHLEAWDIELSFRRLAHRLSKGSTLIVLISLLGIYSFTPAYAQESAQLTASSQTGDSLDQNSSPAQIASDQTLEESRVEARQHVSEIHGDDDFGERLSGTKWKLKNNESNDEAPEPFEFDFSSPGALIKLLALALKIIIAAAIFFMIISWARRNKHLLFGKKKEAEDTIEDIELIESEPIVEEFKPDPNVPQQVLNLWHEGKQRESLSYLYRSSLSYLTTVHDLVIEESDTEYDCLQLVQAKAHQKVFVYFEQVTALWRRLAYGEIVPSLDQLEFLCGDWSKIAAPTVVAEVVADE